MQCFTEVRFFKWKSDDKSVSLRAKSASYGGGSEVLILQKTTGTLSPGSHAGSYNGQDAYNDMLVVENEMSMGRNTDGTNAVCEKQRGGQRMPDKQNFNAVMEEQPMRVRRLTCVECERLQGFPDNWTLIGDWVDSKGKSHKEADSPRYRAIGNSIALPFWEWLAKRIVAQYDSPVTMGSLFDGIAGFPLAFQRAGATPVWASEIDEFCIAVTKKHFPEGGEDVRRPD